RIDGDLSRHQSLDHRRADGKVRCAITASVGGRLYHRPTDVVPMVWVCLITVRLCLIRDEERYSAVMPACRITLAHFETSLRMNAANSSGAPGLNSPPSASSIFWMSGIASMATISRFRRATTSRGAFAGASIPCQMIVSKVGNPASATVGTSGIRRARWAPLVAIALILPSLTNCAAEGIDVAR